MILKVFVMSTNVFLLFSSSYNTKILSLFPLFEQSSIHVTQNGVWSSFFSKQSSSSENFCYVCCVRQLAIFDMKSSHEHQTQVDEFIGSMLSRHQKQTRTLSISRHVRFIFSRNTYSKELMSFLHIAHVQLWKRVLRFI